MSAGTYNYYIVALSVVIAVLASYSALNIAAKISNSSGKSRFFWLFAGSLVMGSGVWSMHFVGMLAFHTHSAVEYDVWLTLISMAASVISSFIAFYMTMPKITNALKIAAGGVIMGTGITSMHYIGMEAMIMDTTITYDPFLWVVSIVIALVASYAALFLFLRFRNQPSSSLLKWLSAIVMGVAICGMHYVGMAAANFHDHDLVGMYESSIDFFLISAVSVMIFIILMISWAVMYFDRHVLEKMAYQDSITGLPNRNEMNRFFSKYRGNETIGVLFLDLDRFKAVNDTLGHYVGDLLVKEVGKRLQTFIKSNQQVFRIGGDEFLIVIDDCNLDQAKQLANDILTSVKQVYHIEGNELYVTGSIGISFGKIEDNDRMFLFRTADTAMYKAKELGKNQYCVYTAEMGTDEDRRLELEKDLQLALKHEQFFLVYQPKWNVKTNQLCGFEALIRWQHPRLGLIAPMEFIPIAEETGQIIPMTRWTLKKACEQCKAWIEKGIKQPVSVNLSAKLFQYDNLVELVEWVLADVELEPSLLELEITESMVLVDIHNVTRQLDQLRAIGVKVSMDDFGTGYSSIGLLDQIPLDALKLDRLFTVDLDNPSKRAIIKAIMMMADQLNLDIIAEGVENKEHTEFLEQLGCEIMQGYYYGKPMTVEKVEEWVKENEAVNAG